MKTDTLTKETETTVEEKNIASEEKSLLRTKLTHVLPTDRLSIEKQLQIAKAYCVIFSSEQKAISVEQAGTVVAPTSVRLMIPFFVDINFLFDCDDKGHIPNKALQDYFRIEEIDPERAKQHLQAILASTWFGKTVLNKLKIAATKQSTIRDDLLIESNASKNHAKKIQTLIDWLIFSNLISLKGELLEINKETSLDSQPPQQSADKAKDDPSPIPEDESPIEIITCELILNPRTRRKIIVKAPAIIKKSELSRINAWLSVQLLVDDAEQECQTQNKI